MRCQTTRRDRGARAFTLVEILVVIVILGSVAAILVPRLTAMGDIQAVSAARSLVSNLQYAQNEAIVQQEPITINFDTGAGSYDLRDSGGTLLKHPISKRDFVMSFPATNGLDRVQILSASFNGASSLTFDPLGAPQQGGQVTVGADGYSYRVNVSPVTGKMTVQSVSP